MTAHVSLEAACAVAEVKPGTIRQWVARGFITRHRDGYDLAEILARIDGRNDAMIRTRRVG